MFSYNTRVVQISGSHGGEYEGDSGMLRCVVWYKFTDVSEAQTATITRAISTSKTSVNFYRTTWRNIPEDNQE
jgi:hypothetical protein